MNRSIGNGGRSGPSRNQAESDSEKAKYGRGRRFHSEDDPAEVDDPVGESEVPHLEQQLGDDSGLEEALQA